MKRQKLLEFVTAAHKGQLRAGGDEYVTHLIRVADSVKEIPNLWEPALCHDLLEDTSIDLKSLVTVLQSFGYTEDDSWNIGYIVWELTDEFTSTKYPNMNRLERKRLEAKRLSRTSWMAQTIKYADITDNLRTSQELGGFRQKMLQEAEYKLRVMYDGISTFRTQALLELQIQNGDLQNSQRQR